jgi:plastocyanin
MRVSAFARLSCVLPLVLVAALGLTRPPFVINQKDKLFSASAMTIAVGDSISFVNDDAVSHNVFSSTVGLQFNLKRQAPGSQRSVTFNTKGTAIVRCAFHPTMKLLVTVQ